METPLAEIDARKIMALAQPQQPQIDPFKLMQSFEYYARHLLWIKTKAGELKPLAFNEAQVKLDLVVEELRKTGKLLRIIVLKARQEGVSTYAEGYIFRASHMNENNRSVIIAHEVESCNQIFSMCKLFYDCLPTAFRPMTKHSNRKEISFAQPDKNKVHTEPGMRSSIEAYTAGKFNVARSSTIHCLHASELGSWAFPEDTVPALMPTVPKTPNSMIIFESTAKGVGNFFHHEWLRAKEGESNFYPFFLAWFDLGEYSFAFPDDKTRQDFISNRNEEEKELTLKYSLRPEQLLWRRLEIKDLSGDIELFRQEYPADDVEAFIVSGAPVFDRLKLRELYTTRPDPKARIELIRNSKGRVRLEPRLDGRLKLWDLPRKEGQYVIGVDVGGFTEREGSYYEKKSGLTGDYTCIQILRRLPYPMVADQVGEWHGRTDHIELAHYLRKLGNMFNEAMVSIEVEKYGLATQNELQKFYWNIYRWQRFDNIRNRFTDKIGWETNVRSKTQLIAFGTHCVYEDSVRINSRDLIEEMMYFVKDGQNASSETGYDDRVMAWMIGLFTMHQTYDTDDLEEIDHEPTKPSGLIIPTSMRIDPNWEEIFEYGQQDQYGGSWLNT